MKVISHVGEMQEVAERLRMQGKRIGVVPTMGYLHDGHLSIIRIAREHSDVVITTIFVNPTQFGPEEDLSRYPRDLQRDTTLATSAGTDILFTPEAKEMYPQDYLTYVHVETISGILEGKFRPTHFRGVTTIVAKLLNITKPHIAVFGQKDAQQAVVIKQMVKDLNLDVQIVVAPIVREPDGLAMSSRNVYLTPSERKEALALSQSLDRAEQLIRQGERSAATVIERMTNHITSQPSATIDYISIVDPSTLEEKLKLTTGETVLIVLAVRIGTTRLIDNTLVSIT